mmetsp:Transcript_752/g.645  ORF Transcript_752/g.645 Transcript_752/m.645 type:complete len:546 (+) Transcript_752:58-1695(+)
MQDTILLVIGCLVVMILLGFTIYSAMMLYTKCCKPRFARYNPHVISANINSSPQMETVHCDDIKATTITISQHHQKMNDPFDKDHFIFLHKPQPQYHMRQRSMSDPDLLADSVVALAIDSESPLKSHRNSPFQHRALTPPSHHSLESTESLRTDDDFDQSVSPLSTPKKDQSNGNSQHHRNCETQIPEISEIMDNSEIQRLILNETANNQDDHDGDDSLDRLIKDMAVIINNIGDEEDNSDAASNNDEEQKMVNTEEEEDEMFEYAASVSQPTMIIHDDENTNINMKMNQNPNKSDDYIHNYNQAQVLKRNPYKNPYMSHKINSSSASSGSSLLTAGAITRLIIGDPDVRIVQDESRSSASIPSDTNFSYSTNLSQYSGFMNQNNQNQQEKGNEDKKLKIKVEFVDFENKNNENENENDEESRTMTYDNSNEDYNILHGIRAVASRKSLGITTIRESVKMKLDEKEESGSRNENDEDGNKEIEIPTPPSCDVKKKIFEYKENIKNLEETSDSAEKRKRRASVNALKENRVVKSKRGLFENNDIRK